MSWKIVSFVTLVVLTAALISYGISLYERPYDLYMRVIKSADPSHGGRFTSLEDLSDLERDQILSYFEAGDDIRNYIKISDEWCPIRDWAESTYTYGDLNVKYENYYYQVSLWRRDSFYPSVLENTMHMILTMLTIIMWVIILSLAAREREQRQQLAKAQRFNRLEAHNGIFRRLNI